MWKRRDVFLTAETSSLASFNSKIPVALSPTHFHAHTRQCIARKRAHGRGLAAHTHTHWKLSPHVKEGPRCLGCQSQGAAGD